MGYRAGDFNRICDRCGFKKHASQTTKEWDNLIVCRECFEERHPQDFVRGRKDNQTVPDPRPEPVDALVGPLTTTLSAAASPGATTINVTLSTRMFPNDHIGITLSDGNVHRAVIDTVPSSSQITLTAATKLPGSASSGALLVDYDAVADVDIG